MFIGIDLGTTACKVVMFDKDGKILSEYNHEYDLIFKGSYVEQNADDWWNLCIDGIKSVVKETGVSKVEGISVSTQSISFVPVDSEGNVLYNAISWLDVRADEYCKKLDAAFGYDKVYSITGKSLMPDYSLPKLWWFKDNCPDVYENAWKFLFPLDFLNFRLCGNPLCDYTVAGGSMLYDIENKCWNQELADFCGFDVSKLPEVACLGSFVGNLLPEVAYICGILPGCKIYLGGQDQKLAAIGAGIKDNVCTVSFGTATAISKLIKTEDNSISLFRFNDESFISEIAIMTSGAALKWLTNTLYDGISYRQMDELAESSSNGSGGVSFEPDLTTGGNISGLTLSTTKANIVYALYEGVSKQIADAVKRLGGADYLLVFGGGSKSDIWCRILSDVSGMELKILETSEVASLGAAMIASQFTINPAGVKKTIKI